MRGFQKNTIHKNGLYYNHLIFDNVSGFNRFVDGETQRLNRTNKDTWKLLVLDTDLNIQKGTNWYGEPHPKTLKDLEDHTYFLGMHLLEKLQPKIKDSLSEYLNYLNDNVMPKPKLEYNDRNLGMFSFDRAAMGIFKSSRINVSTPIDRTTSQLKIALGQTDVSTRVRKVFAYFKDKNVALPSMKLYIMAGANAHVGGNEMLFVGLAASELVQFLEARGVPVEVNVLIGTRFDRNLNMAVIRIKSFQEMLDKNQLLLMSADPRYFRYRGFKALIAMSNQFGLTIPNSLGRIDPGMGKDFVKVLGSDGFVFEQTYSLESAAKEVKRIIENYNQNKKNEKGT